MSVSRKQLLPFMALLASGCAGAGASESERGASGSALALTQQVEPSGDSTAAAVAAAGRRVSVPSDSIVYPPAPLVRTPDPLRGLYVNRWAALGRRAHELIALADSTEVNALVIDVKDDRGFVLYESGVALAREIGADERGGEVLAMSRKRIRSLLDRLRELGIYPIARIVVAKDPMLAAARPQWAIIRKSDSLPWRDNQGKLWLDPHRREVWQYAADLAVEAVELGFSEVQLDYVRFPDEGRLMAEAAFPLANGRQRAEVVREQLGYVRSRMRATGVRFTIDVFGLTTSDTTDMGIGQKWEMFVDQADVVLPMTYPSHYARGSYGIAVPNARPFEVIDAALRAAKRRSGGIDDAALIVPWYQDFTLGQPRYGPAEVRAQIRAGYENGIHSWILWNPRSVYNEAALLPRDSVR